MEDKYFWPLVGVILGWLLTFLSSNLKDRAENRQRLGRLLANLVTLHRQLIAQIAAADSIKGVSGGWEGYEKLRAYVVGRHLLEPDSFEQSLNESIKEIAGSYPMQALSLSGTLGILRKNKNASLTSSSKKAETYVKLLSVYEVGLDLCEASLRKDIRWFALRHGVVTFFRINFDMAQRKKRGKGAEDVLKWLKEEAREDRGDVSLGSP